MNVSVTGDWAGLERLLDALGGSEEAVSAALTEAAAEMSGDLLASFDRRRTPGGGAWSGGGRMVRTGATRAALGFVVRGDVIVQPPLPHYVRYHPGQRVLPDAEPPRWAAALERAVVGRLERSYR